MIRYRFLEPHDLRRMHRTLITAFADYAIPHEPTEPGLEAMMVRRGVDYELSVGAFDGDHMVGVMAIGVGEFLGRQCAYDIFTGVIPSHRNRGIGGDLLLYARPEFVRRGLGRVMLEVLKVNEPAIRAYRRIGFKKARDLVCLQLDEPIHSPGEPPDAGVDVDCVPEADWSRWERFADWEPTWQNSRASISRDPAEKLFFSAFRGGSCVGFAAYAPLTRDLFQLAVARQHRRRGIGSRLLRAVVEVADGPVRIINVDAAYVSDVRFYQSCGAAAFAEQFEMVLDLDE